ncbi:hypothetical protein M1771_00130 [Spiroplasma citri]|uniref:Uncharacterized protein n=1 Tax=Spiroplasma citri TaxID=2133 RepID=A0AAX3SZ83_SPICI|nr:hypothetical protein [Spiroplasma citri]WFG96462.1 hypothetical protein M0C40_00130 [Spiroplasma citri]WFH00356.1 hypothetical protein M1771_00130 [Spiroplasma citri]
MPFLYGFFCVWAFWNPFLKTDQIPMAIVNRDANLCVIYKPKNDKDQSIANATEVRYLTTKDEATCLATLNKMRLPAIQVLVIMGLWDHIIMIRKIIMFKLTLVVLL